MAKQSKSQLLLEEIHYHISANCKSVSICHNNHDYKNNAIIIKNSEIIHYTLAPDLAFRELTFVLTGTKEEIGNRATEVIKIKDIAQFIIYKSPNKYRHVALDKNGKIIGERIYEFNNRAEKDKAKNQINDFCITVKLNL